LSIRPKFFLTLAAFCVTPLLIISFVNYFHGLRDTKTLLRKTLELESSEITRHSETMIDQREAELKVLAGGPFLSYVRSAGSEGFEQIKSSIESLPPEFAAVACFDANQRQLLLAEKTFDKWTYRTKDFLPEYQEPIQFVWNLRDNSPALHHSIVYHPRLGHVWRSTIPIFLTSEPGANAQRGGLVADIRLSRVFAALDQRTGASTPDTQRQLIVLDSSGRVVYHENEAFRNHDIAAAVPGFAPLAAAMTSTNSSGAGEFQNTAGETWMVSYRPVFPGLSLAVGRSYSLASRPAMHGGWIGVALALVLGLLTAFVITWLYQRKSQSLDRVAESVAAIAKGNLDEELFLASRDDMRGLADNVNLMTERLREQFAHEAETRQLNSFVKLSAMLAHDLKNAIEGLSLMVGNMERHFDNPAFRADAMQALTAATDKLRKLVTRLSNPVNTLSGEFKVPYPTDLVPPLLRVVDQIAAPLRHLHEIDVQLPESLLALADGERIERVMENLVLNAVEAMANQRGKLTVTAGEAEAGKVFFSVADTGPGMSAEFVQQRLFRPFSTTKARGVGLGLYTCREVVRANNGVIEVDTKPGSGTIFRVVLASAQFQ
jgi:signal transduction histidine kinase